MGTRFEGGIGPVSGCVPTPVSCMKLSSRAAPLFIVKSLVKDRGGAGANYGGVDA